MAGSEHITVSRNRAERMQDIIIGAIITMVLLAIAFLAMLQFPIPLRETPIDLLSVRVPEETVYCPGETFTYVTDAVVTEPGIFTLHVGIMEAESRKFINPTLEQLPSVPRSQTSRVEQPVSFQIPDLPPGDYIRVAGIDADHVDSVPVFVEVPFTIRGDCNE